MEDPPGYQRVHVSSRAHGHGFEPDFDVGSRLWTGRLEALGRLTPVDAVYLVDFSAIVRSEPPLSARREGEEHAPNGRVISPPARRHAKLDG